jgi:hypothetical protein
MGCEAIYKELMARIEAIVKEKWPHAINTTGFIEFAEKNHPELKAKHDTLYKEANQLWINCQDTEFKKIATEWGQTVLQMYRLFNGHLKTLREAA